MIWLWGVIVIVFLVLEIALTGIFEIWFAIGALLAGIVAWFFPANVLAQAAVFIVTSGLLALLFSRHFIDVNGYHPAKNPSRVYSILGQTAIVTKEIDTANGLGKITINGDIWSAKSKTNEIIPENTKVKILEIDGVKAVVEVLKEEE